MFGGTGRAHALDGTAVGREVGGVEHRPVGIGHDGVQHAKKNELRPHLRKYWKIPPDGDAGFVAAMEDVLDVYHRPYTPDYPVVYMDESSKQLIGEVRPDCFSAGSPQACR